jgi:hypothetical protein
MYSGVPVIGFMHVAMMGDWRRVVSEQLRKMRRSGLWRRTRELHVGVVGPSVRALRLKHPKVQLHYFGEDVAQFEFPTLEHLYRFSQQEDALVYYIHTKGVSRQPDPAIRDWRHLLEYFVLERWRECVSVLQRYDCCGVNAFYAPYRHFSGNFWWATTEYIRTLPPPSSTPSPAVLGLGRRHACEIWIGLNPLVKLASLHNSGVEHHESVYPRDRYAVERPPEKENVGTFDGNTPIYGFLHVALVNDWRSIVNEQILKMKVSGLWQKAEQVFVGLVGGDRSRFDYADEKLSVSAHSPALESGEQLTLGLLQEFCHTHICRVFYIHTKGVVRASASQQQWRHSMEHFVVTRHEDCLFSLRDHDVCGINWSAKSGWCRFFGGNFWWANSTYIRSLPDVNSLSRRPGEPSIRFACERWIGENPVVRAACLYDSRTDHYADQLLPRHRYAAVHDVQPHPAFRVSSDWHGLENSFQDLLEPCAPIRIVVNLGVGSGVSLFCLAAALRDATILGIDNFNSDPLAADSDSHPNRGTTSSNREERIRNFLPSFPNVRLLKMNFDRASELIQCQIDVVCFNGIRDHLALSAAVKTWLPKLRKGGCMLFHGTRNSKDVKQFFDSLHGRKGEIAVAAGIGSWYPGK